MSSPDDRTGASWLRYSHLGLTYCLTVLVFVGLGYLGDQRFGTDPWLTVAGMLLGASGATYSLVRAVSRVES